MNVRYFCTNVVFKVIGRGWGINSISMYSVHFEEKPRITCEDGGWVGFCPKCTYYI